jgi:hypothetical protein
MKNDPRAGAEIGKIVNLMAGDATRVSSFDSDPQSRTMTNIFQIAKTTAVLYTLYGGMIVLILIDSVYANRMV